MYEILKAGDVAQLVDAVLIVLEKLGMWCQNSELMRAVEQQGAVVDYEREVARFPRRVMEGFIDEVRKEDQGKWEIKGQNQKTLYSGYVPPLGRPNRFQAPYVPFIFHPLATFYWDVTGEKRKGNREDFITLTKLGEVLHPELGVGHSLTLSDVPPVIEPLEAARLLLQYARQPSGVYVQDLRQLPYLMEIEAIAGIEDPCWHWFANVGFASPLRLGQDIAERFVAMVKSGNYPAKVYTMGVSGVNLPVTTAGCTVITAAEFLVLWFAARCLNPSIPLTGLVLCGRSDMRTGDVQYWGFDTLIRRLTVCELIKKWTGVVVSPGVGEYTPSRLPGFTATLEKAYLAMTFAAFTGYHPEVGIGHLEGGLSFSPVQLLLDRELAKGLRFLESPAVNPESIGLETILEVGFGNEQNYLEVEHTLRNFSSALWSPELLDLGDEAKALAKARKKVEELIAAYQQPEIDPDKIAKVDQIIEKARRKLLP